MKHLEVLKSSPRHKRIDPNECVFSMRTKCPLAARDTVIDIGYVLFAEGDRPGFVFIC